MDDRDALKKKLDLLSESHQSGLIEKDEYERSKADLEKQILEAAAEEPSVTSEPEEKVEVVSIPEEQPEEKSDSKPIAWVKPLAVFLLILFIVFTLYFLIVGMQPETESERDVLPSYVCESDADCAEAGKEVYCQYPATENATCVTQESTSLNISILTSTECVFCDTTRMRMLLTQWFPDAEFTVYANESTYPFDVNITQRMLPVYLVNGSVTETLRFDEVKRIFVENDGWYRIKDTASGAQYSPHRLNTSETFWVFLRGGDETSRIALENMNEFLHLFDGEIDLEYFVFGTNEGSPQDACLSQDPRAYTEYIACTLEEGNCSSFITPDVLECLEEDVDDILNRNQHVRSLLGVHSVPAFIVDNQYLFTGVYAANEVKEFYCTINEHPFCDTELTISLI